MSIGTFFKPRWRWVTVVVFLGVLFLARLGFWQLDRLEWRRELNAEKLAGMNSEPLDLTEDLSGFELTEMLNRPISAVGEYDFENQFSIESQIFENQVGQYLLTPLILEGTQTAVLVNRGWIPDTETDFSVFDEPGRIEIVGRIQKGQTLSGDRVTQIEDNRIYRIDVAAAAEVLPYETLPIYVLPETDEIIDSALPYLPVADLSLDEGSHFSYALQWFSFALMLIVIYGIYVKRQENM